MGSREVFGVGVALDCEFEGFEAVDGDPVGACNEGEEVLLLLLVEAVQKLPEMPM